MLTVSWVSSAARLIRYRAGTAAGSSRACARGAGRRVQVEHPDPGCLQPRDRRGQQPPGQLIAELVVALAQARHAPRCELERRRWRSPCVGAELPLRAAASARTARSRRRCRASPRSAVPGPGTRRSRATWPLLISQMLAAWPPSSNSRWPAGNRDGRGRRGQPRHASARSRAGRRGRPAANACDPFMTARCAPPPAGPRGPRVIPACRASACSAATSSVRSMPTGHQTMHRPQPTQPEDAELVVPGAELVGQPLPVPAHARGAHRAAVQVGEVQIEAGRPSSATARRGRRSGR